MEKSEKSPLVNNITYAVYCIINQFLQVRKGVTTKNVKPEISKGKKMKIYIITLNLYYIGETRDTLPTPFTLWVIDLGELTGH